MNRALARLLAASTALLVDFDGPLCSIFSDYTNTAVSADLRSILSALNVQTPDHVIQEWDPLEILRWTATLGRPSITHAVEDGLRVAEVRAARTASPTPGGHNVLTAACDRGQLVSVVSNNSAPGVEEYLQVHGLTKYVSYIVGREPYCPGLMKPNPRSVLLALEKLGMRPDACVLIGDSLADVVAAHTAGVPVIGFANASRKEDLLAAAGADAIVTSMADVVSALRLDRPPG